MNKILVLAEKPSVARDIARVLKCKRKGNGYIEGDKYIVTWALGHLVTLADPEVYKEQYKTWKIEDLPIIPSYLKTVVIKKSGKQFNNVKQQLHRKDVSEIIIATDAGREGELVARWIIEKSHVNKKIKRLWISSVTDKAIKEGFKNLKEGKIYENLYASAVSRAEADWVVGINATRALTCKYNAQLSCGRVQTPTLAIISKREEEIKNFKPKDYYEINALGNGIKFTWKDDDNSIRIFNKEKSHKIISEVKGKDAKIIEVKKINKKTFSPKLYDLTELQRDANKIFGYSAKETLSIMQRLYENYKILTYPRTDSRYISEDIVDTLKDRVRACAIGAYSSFGNKILKGQIKPNKSFVDNSKVSDHHAIIPTEEQVKLNLLSSNERKIYDLVVKRFLSVLYTPFEYEQTTIKAKIGKEQFIAKGKVVTAKGFKEIYNNFEDELEDNIQEQKLPRINKGDIIKITNIFEEKKETIPPSPFTEATLLSAMENPVKYMSGESKELINIIGETGGIGTVATRADIIEKLFNTFLIEKKGNSIYTTSKGRQLLELVPEELKSPSLTAEWEKKLSKISKGKLNKNTFINEMKEYTNKIVKEIKNSKEKFKHDNITGNKCPECGKYMLEVNGKKGRMLICQDRECGYKRYVARKTNARCPNCHKKLELRGDGQGQIFVCSCGYREKLSTFNDRKKKEKNNMSKREVAKYLKNQNNSDEINSALKDALSKLKF